MPLHERKNWYQGTESGAWRTLSLDEMGVAIARSGTQTPGDPAQVGVIRLAIKWLASNAHKAPIAVRPRVTGDPAEPDTEAELCQIWNRSRPTKLIHRILTDLWIRGKGNAVVKKVRNPATSRVERLEPVDVSSLTWRKETRFWRQGSIDLVRENYIWISLGSDPECPEKGEDQWAGFYDDLRTLREEAKYTADVLENGGVVGIVISKKDSNDFLGDDVVDRITKDATAATTGSKRGSVLVVGASVGVDELGSTPERMALDKLTLGAQARVAANLNTALMVLGLPDPGKTYSNLREAKQGTFLTGVVGFHDVLKEALEMDLLPDTDGGLSVDTHEVVWIYDDLEELREDTDAVHKRARDDLAAGGISPNEFRAEIGMDPTDQEGADAIRIPATAAAPGPTGP